MENQNKSKSHGVLVTLCVLVVILIVVILYVANQSSQQQSVSDQVSPQTQVNSTVPETTNQPVKTKPAAPVQSQTDTTANDLMFSRRQACSQRLADFEQYEQTQYQQLGSKNNFTLTGFVVGYSPSLQACVGGFNAASQPGGNYVGILSQYMIVNLDTYKSIDNLPGSAYGVFMEDSNPAYPAHHYQDYLKALSNLTGGQIQ